MLDPSRKESIYFQPRSKIRNFKHFLNCFRPDIIFVLDDLFETQSIKGFELFIKI